MIPSDLVQEACLILTENATQSRLLIRQYPKLHIMPWFLWLQAQWQQCAILDPSLPVLLSEHQQNQLWLRCIQRNQEPRSDTKALVSLAKSAYQLKMAWDLKLSEVLLEQTQNWLEWQEDYLNECKKNNFFDEWAWLWCLIDLIKSSVDINFQKLKIPNKIAFFGFLEFSPAQKRFMDVLKDKDVIVENINSDKIDATRKKINFSSSEEEMYAMVAWAAEETKNNIKRVACLVPDLNNKKHEIERFFFEKEKNIYIHSKEDFYNIPLVYSALTILKLLRYQLSIEDWSYLLRSPWVGAYEKEKYERLKLLETLYEKNEYQFSVKQVCELSQSCPDLLLRLKQISFSRKNQTLSAWKLFFVEILSVMGWREEIKLTGKEQRVFESWNKLLLEFERLSFLKETFFLKSALEQLHTLVAIWSFQPSGSLDVPIHILSLHQSVGLKFDAVWVLGMQDSVLPASPKPNPFLPLNLQRQKKVAHASHDWELRHAHRLFYALNQTSDKIIFSYAKQNEVEELEASSFLSSIEEIKSPDLYFNFKKEFQKDENQFEYYEDDRGEELDNVEIRGGMTALKEQSMCAFRGFAYQQLKTKPLPSIEYGLTPREKGIVIHRALELIWKELKTQERLIKMPLEALEGIILEKIDQSVMKIVKKRMSLFNSEIIFLEKKRLKKLIHRWFMHEKNRESFSIHELEKSFEVVFSGLKFTLRIDRIDCTDSQRYYIVDYKTNVLSVNDWLEERPSEPQLPFYAITSDLPVAGLLFGQLRSDNLGFRGMGLADDKILKPHTAQEWEDQLKAWHQNLNGLIKALKEGDASLNPKEGLRTCKACYLQALCRLYDN